MSGVIIGLSGYAQSGKDTVAEILVEGYGFKKIAFAGILRECMAALNPIVDAATGVRYNDVVDAHGYEFAKANYPEVRALLQRMGTEVGRNVLGENVWVDAAQNKIMENFDEHFVFTDMRFPNEYEAVLGMDGYVWRVTRPGTGPINGHYSEVALDGHTFDLTIDNSGSIVDLRRIVELAMLEIQW